MSGTGFSSLTQHDIARLEKSWLTAELIEQASLFRVDSFDGAQLVGRNGNSDYAGIVFPYIWPGETNPREFRLRRDKPDFELKDDGTLKEKTKYLSPPGRGNLLYFAPNTIPEWLTDISLPVVITEGEKKTLALSRLAWHGLGDAADIPRFLPVGLSGVWNFRDNSQKANNAQGQRVNVNAVISDIDRLVWTKREVLICYDVNVATNTSVQAARNELAKGLEQRGATVRFVNLLEQQGVNGVDDLLHLRGADYVLALFDSAATREEESKKKGRPKSQATVLAELAEEAELFHTPEGEPFATVPVGDVWQTWPIKTKGFRDWLGLRFYESEASTPSSQAIQDALSTLTGKACFSGAQHEVFTRIASHNGEIYVDLADSNCRVVRINQDGWQVVEAQDAPIKFRRSKGMRALPEPKQGQSIEVLRSFINIKDEDWPLLVCWLIACLRPGFPFPVLVLHGEQGSAKSTLSRLLRSLIDPSQALLRSQPRNEQDLMVAAVNGWLIALDNLSHVPEWLSDALSRLSTGGGFSVRTLYEDKEETIFEAKRPILLNGIEELATRSDLLDRSIILHLPTIPAGKRKRESDLWGDFERARPYILGALFDGVSHALREQNNVTYEGLPRMADFAVWCVAAENGIGLPSGSFIEAYTRNGQAANDLALDAAPVASALIAFVEKHTSWEGRATELLKEINLMADEATQRQKGWPKRAHFLSNILKRLAPNLRRSGIEITQKRTKHGSHITLEWVGETASLASSASSF